MKQGIHFSAVLIFLLVAPGLAAEGQRGQRTARPVFVASSNGVFSVCHLASEGGTNVLYRWKDVFISRDALPVAGPYSDVVIYDVGERPAIEHGDGVSFPTSPKAPPPSFYHCYGAVPFSIVDIDPPLEYSIDKAGELLIGFHLRGTFYAVGKVENPALAKEAVSRKHWSKVIQVSLPAHRQNDLESLKAELLKNVQNRTDEK